MKIALTSDTHCHNYSGSQITTLPDGCNSRLRDIMNCMNWITDTAKERGCVTMIHGGDITHNRRFMHVNAWARTSAMLRGMNTRLPVEVLEGNHDLDQSGDGTSTVAALDGIIRAHTKAEVTQVAGLKVGWLPYTNDPEVVKKETARLAKAGARILIAHLGIGDPRFSDCIPVDYEAPGCINVADLNPDLFQQVFLGHYHTSQELVPNMRYLGSPLQLSFKEAGIPKGYWIYDSETNEPEWIENTISPRYHKVEQAADLSKIPETDFVWVTGASEDFAETAKNTDRKIPLRVDIAPKERVEARLSKGAVTDHAKLAEYARIADTSLTPEEIVALADLGVSLVIEAEDELARK